MQAVGRDVEHAGGDRSGLAVAFHFAVALDDVDLVFVVVLEAVAARLHHEMPKSEFGLRRRGRP